MSSTALYKPLPYNKDVYSTTEQLHNSVRVLAINNIEGENIQMKEFTTIKFVKPIKTID